jgi:DNA-binding NtrC family response regulator
VNPAEEEGDLEQKELDLQELNLEGARVLLVDDQPQNLDVLIGVLEPSGYDIRVSRSGEVALELVSRFAPDLILLDVMMPGMDGFETCRRLKAAEASRSVPVIFLTALADPGDIIKGFEAGGVDYVAKPFNRRELSMRVATQLRLRLAVKELDRKNAALKSEIARRQALSAERDRLAGHLSLLSDEETKRWGVEGFVGHSKTLKTIMGEIGRLQQAPTTSVLITGESGTGKELVARAIHFGSERAKGPFVPVNCSAVPAELADSLFFGHVKGAFTGAAGDRVGYFELAGGGTLFLDELGDMPLVLQAKLLRALEDRKVLPVGGDEERSVDVRVLAATNADLLAAVEQGNFRQDLYYRLAGFPVHLPPLRQRREDISLLAQHFLGLFVVEMGRSPVELSPAATAALRAYDFPGNIRQLKNVIERAMIESEGGSIEVDHLHLEGARVGQPAADKAQAVEGEALPLNLDAAELVLINRALKQCKGNVAKAARLLGTNRMRIYRRLAQEEEEEES